MMTRRSVPWITLAVTIPMLLSGPTPAGESPSEAAGAFERFKALEGRWDAPAASRNGACCCNGWDSLETDRDD